VIDDYEQQIRRALPYSGGTFTYEEVRDAVKAGRLQFWALNESFVITDVVNFPSHKNLHFFLLGGAMDDMKAMQGPIEAWGKSQGCTTASALGRKGWERSFIVERGWAPMATLFTKEL